MAVDTKWILIAEVRIRICGHGVPILGKLDYLWWYVLVGGDTQPSVVPENILFGAFEGRPRNKSLLLDSSDRYVGSWHNCRVSALGRMDYILRAKHSTVCDLIITIRCHCRMTGVRRNESAVPLPR